MIIISSSLVLEQTGTEGANNPVIGYEQLATIANVTATSEDADNPVTNVCNPATNLVWLSGSTSTQYITVVHDRVDPIDYVGIAEHNLGSTGCTVSVEGYSELDEFDAPIWVELVEGALLADDQPAVFRFEPQSLIGVRIKMVPDGEEPSIAVVYVGKLLVLPRPIYEGHTPITLGRSAQVTNGRTERGKFLGRIVTQESVSTSVQLPHLPRGWYRTHMKPFTEFAIDNPFFFAWRPQEFPAEVGYAWLTADPRPSNSRLEGFVEVELSLSGIVT
jgi:hypothetical protein